MVALHAILNLLVDSIFDSVKYINIRENICQTDYRLICCSCSGRLNDKIGLKYAYVGLNMHYLL